MANAGVKPKEQLEKRVTIRYGIVIEGQRIDPETDEVINQYHKNTHGGVYARLEEAEAGRFQDYLDEKIGPDFDNLAKKVRQAARAFGLTELGLKPSGK